MQEQAPSAQLIYCQAPLKVIIAVVTVILEIRRLIVAIQIRIRMVVVVVVVVVIIMIISLVGSSRSAEQSPPEPELGNKGTI